MPGGVDDELGRDRAGVGQDGRDLAPGRHLEPRHADPCPDPHAEGPSGVSHGMRRAVRVEVAVTGQVDRAVQRLGRDGRHQPARFLGPDHPRVEPDPARPAGRPFELEQLLAARRKPEAPDGLECAEASVQLDAVAAEFHHRRRRVERRDQAGRLARGAGRQLGLLDEQDVGPAGQRQVVGDAAAGDPATDHDDPGLLPAHGRPRYLSGRARSRRPSPRPVVGMNDHSYDDGWRTSRITPCETAARSSLFAAVVGNGRNAAPPVPTTNSRMPRTRSSCAFGSWGANRS